MIFIGTMNEDDHIDYLSHVIITQIILGGVLISACIATTKFFIGMWLRDNSLHH